MVPWIFEQIPTPALQMILWASTDASILAGGYIDGDILLWKISKGSSTGESQEAGPWDNVVQLQRLMQKSCTGGQTANPGIRLTGQLIIYGGDEIGSDEVVTVTL